MRTAEEHSLSMAGGRSENRWTISACRSRWLVGMAFLLLQSVGHAQSFNCERGQEKRLVKLDYPGRDNLCEVVANSGDGSRKVVWLANGGSEFCSQKIDDLIGKYRNRWGWTCEPAESRTEFQSLSSSERLFLDEMVKSVILQGKQATPAFVISGVRAFSNQAQPRSTLVAQLVIESVDGSANTDRVYVVEFTEDGYKLNAFHVGVDRLLNENGQLAGKALVTRMNDDRSFLVTSAYVQESGGESQRNCVSEAALRPGKDGQLELISKPKVACQ